MEDEIERSTKSTRAQLRTRSSAPARISLSAKEQKKLGNSCYFVEREERKEILQRERKERGSRGSRGSRKREKEALLWDWEMMNLRARSSVDISWSWNFLRISFSFVVFLLWSFGDLMITRSDPGLSSSQKKQRNLSHLSIDATNVVKILTENTVAASSLLKALLYLTPKEIDHISEERGLFGCCGLPVCPNLLPDHQIERNKKSEWNSCSKCEGQFQQPNPRIKSLKHPRNRDTTRSRNRKWSTSQKNLDSALKSAPRSSSRSAGRKQAQLCCRGDHLHLSWGFSRDQGSFANLSLCTLK